MARKELKPLNYFLNEQHELARTKQGGGGQAPHYVGIDWTLKGRRIARSLSDTAKAIRASNDPLKEDRIYLLAKPVAEVTKASTQKKKAPHGTFEEETDFAKEHTRVFGRLGLDLIEVTDAGDAVIHARPERFDQLSALSSQLGDLGVMEQARWATVDSFSTIPPELRIDSDWLNSIKRGDLAEVIIELQPLLGRLEIETVLRSIAGRLAKDKREGLMGTGSDFSGRQWIRGRLQEKSLRQIASDYFSVQSLHPPLLSLAALAKAASVPSISSLAAHTPPANINFLPTVAVFDHGVPGGHAYLNPYRRGQYTAPDAAGGIGRHGALVASRVVFGEQDFSAGLDHLPDLKGTCRFLDVNVAGGNDTIHDKSVSDAMAAIVGTYPDVRVFNFSFAADRPLASCSSVERRERLLSVQDLDNFIFQNDVVIAVAAGNSPPGQAPVVDYPNHIDDPSWRLGHWASGFNTLVCGAYVGALSATGIVNRIGWPSPFTRIGPGIAEAPVPSFCATGGDRTRQHTFGPGMGVWVCSYDGRWEDHAGTSFSVPLLAREAAFAFELLQKYCQQDTRPFAATVKAFLALTATQTFPDDDLTEALSALCKRTLGRGEASANRLRTPSTRSAIFFWQGLLDGPSDTALVQCPIPEDWYASAEKPMLRVIVAADVPVNAATHEVWACREITLRLRTAPEADAIRPSRSIKNHHSHPVTERLYDLKKLPKSVISDGGMWILEMSYADIADYHPAIDFSPQQRCAFAAELFDDSETPTSPQRALQAIPSFPTMNRLSIQRTPVRVPVILKSRV
jgi:hypothetical protein